MKLENPRTASRCRQIEAARSPACSRARPTRWASPPPSASASRSPIPSKIVYPGDGVTKAQLVAYYDAVAEAHAAAHRASARSRWCAARRDAASRFFQKHDSGGFPARVQEGPDHRERRPSRHLPLHRRRGGPRRRRADERARIPHLGQPYRQARKCPTASSSTSTPTRASISRGAPGGRCRHPRPPRQARASRPFRWSPAARASTSSRRCSRRARLAGGQSCSATPSPKSWRRRARPLHRQYPQGEAQGPHVRRLSAQRARRDRRCPILDAPREGAPCAVPVSWDELATLEAANGFSLEAAAARARAPIPGPTISS